MEVTNKGTIVVSNVTGKTQLYGSKTNHHSYISLSIYKCKGGDTMDPFDYYNQDGAMPLINIDLSMLQFAEMISSIGKGEGTRCTIRSFDGEKTEKYVIPDQHESIVKYAKSLDQRSNDHIRSVRKQLDDICLDGKRPTKAQMIEMISLLDRADTDRSNTDFIATQAEKIFEKAIGDAKQQIDSYAMHIGVDNVPKIDPSSSKNIEYKPVDSTI